MINADKLRYNITKRRWRAPLVWVRHRGLTSNDTFVASYPRSGSTWLRFMLAEALTKQAVEFPQVRASIPGVGRHQNAPRLLPSGGRLLQTHEQFRKDYRKAIYLVRDVRDVIISEYYFLLRRGIYAEDFEVFCTDFLMGRANGFGSWGNHVESWLTGAKGTGEQVFLLKYEDMRKDPEMILAEVLEFLGLQLNLEAIQTIVQNNSIDSMRKKEDRVPENFFRGKRSDVRFIRQGKVGGWKNNLEARHVALIEQAAGDTLERIGYSLVGAGS